MLFEQERHEPLTPTIWDESSARATIERIVKDTTDRFTPERLWPVHPLDNLSGVVLPQPFKMLYFGAAGVIWALDYLARVGATEIQRDFSSTVAELLEWNRKDVRPFAPEMSSLLIGDVGILLLQWKLAPSESLATQLSDAIEANERHPAREFMWGAPGTMLAALLLHEWTQEPRWAALFRRSVGQLWKELEFVSEPACVLWTQELFGARSMLVGAVHGFAGNVFPVIRARHLLEPQEWNSWSRHIGQTIEATALHDRLYANWPQSVGVPRPGRTALLVQHCHGAPGIVNCLADFPDSGIDDLLTAAGELTWAAGPLRKGLNLCHGTAGNGFAFLKLFRRAQDSRWLDRARAFAMHAMAQSERHAEAYGQYRYSLWTGDLGLALYLWCCIHAEAWFPTMDVF